MHIHILFLGSRVQGSVLPDHKSPSRVTQLWSYLWHMITLPKLQAEDPLRNRWYAVMLRDDVVQSRHSYCLCYRARLQPCDPCFCIVRPRPVQSETESGIDGFPNGQSVRRAAEPWGGKIRRRSCSWRREQMETATRAACEKLESHRPRSRGSSKDKTSDARRIPPAQDKVPTNHPIVLALNPSSKVVACLVARTRITGPEVRIYTRRVRSGATVCAPVGRLSKQSQEQSVTGKLASPGSPSARKSTRSHYFFRAERRSERGAGSNVCSPAVESGEAIGERP